jgi:hypothetical protein
MPCHLASGLGAGFFAVCIGSPVDVVKSRLMGAHDCHRVLANLTEAACGWSVDGGSPLTCMQHALFPCALVVSGVACRMLQRRPV